MPNAYRLPAVKVARHRAYSSDVWLLNLRVSRFRFDPVVGHNRVDGPRETLLNMAKRTHALAGINTDAFYWTDNDLVVQTSSMYGGAPRESQASFLLDAGGKVTHFDYFRNQRTEDAVVDGLIRDEPTGYQRIGPLS